jgi:nucleoside deoxyribosyltransferase
MKESTDGRPIIYLAGPFFNVAQIELCRQVKDVLDRNTEFSVFWPYEANPKVTISDPAEAVRVFQQNADMVARSHAMIAIVDWELPKDEYIVRMKNGHFQERINVPDAGTVWEIGAAWAAGALVALFSASQDRKVNLMLSQSAVGTAYGLKQLWKFIRPRVVGELNWRELSDWKGEQT